MSDPDREALLCAEIIRAATAIQVAAYEVLDRSLSPGEARRGVEAAYDALGKHVAALRRVK